MARKPGTETDAPEELEEARAGEDGSGGGINGIPELMRRVIGDVLARLLAGSTIEVNAEIRLRPDRKGEATTLKIGKKGS